MEAPCTCLPFAHRHVYRTIPGATTIPGAIPVEEYIWGGLPAPEPPADALPDLAIGAARHPEYEHLVEDE